MPSEHDITIYFANKPTYNRFKVALEIQDACNIIAISRELVKVVEAARAEPGFDVSGDPAVILLVSKLESLVWSDKHFSEAYDACQAKAEAYDPTQAYDRPARAQR